MKWIAVAALAAGCAPVIQSASPESVSIMYEAPQMSVEDTAETARIACAQYGKQAKLVSDVHSVPTIALSQNLGQRIATWSCE